MSLKFFEGKQQQMCYVLPQGNLTFSLATPYLVALEGSLNLLDEYPSCFCTPAIGQPNIHPDTGSTCDPQILLFRSIGLWPEKREYRPIRRGKEPSSEEKKHECSATSYTHAHPSLLLALLLPQASLTVAFGLGSLHFCLLWYDLLASLHLPTSPGLALHEPIS